MPCRDGGPMIDYDEERRNVQKANRLANLEATLCGVLTVLRDAEHVKDLFGDDDNVGAVLDNVDWKEAGVTRKWAEDWWIKHQEEDIARRKKEAAERDAQAARRRALAKLTKEDRAALGLRG